MMKIPHVFRSSALNEKVLRIILVFLTAGLSWTQAATRTWTGATNSNWATATNWGGTAPATGDSLIFTSATGSGGLTLSDNLMTPGTFNIAGFTFNAGSGAYVINPAAAGTNGFTLTGNMTNNSTNNQTINDLITMTSVRTFTTATGGGSITLGGNISGASGGILTAGSGLLILSGTNTYTGNTTVANATTLQLNGASSLSSSTALTLNSGSILQLRGNANTSFTAASLANTPNGSITIDVNQATAGNTNNTLTLTNGFTTNPTSTINVTGGNGYTLGLGNISGSGNATDAIFNVASGVGLNIASFTGSAGGNDGFAVQGAGNTSIGTITAGTAKGVSLTVGTLAGPTGTVTLNGANTWKNAGTNNSSITLNSGTLALNNTGVFGSSFQGFIINGGSLDALVPGITNSSNLASTLSGDLTFIGTNSLNLGTGAVNITGGVRTITVNNNTLTLGSLMTLGNLTGSGSYGVTKAGAGTLTTTTLLINSGASVKIGDTGGTFNLGAITRVAGGTADFSGSNIAGINFSGTQAVASGASSGNILISNAGVAYATANNGADWAIVPSAGTVNALGSYQTGAENTWAATNNVQVTDSAALTASRTINSLKLVTSTAGQSLNIGTGQLLTLNTGGLLFTGTNNYTISNGSLRSNTAANSELVIHQYGTGNLTINSTIVNGIGNSGLTKSGSGTLVLSGNNTYTGGNFFNEGTVKLGVSQNGTTSSALGIGNAGKPSLTIGTGAFLDLNGFDQTINGAQGTGTILNSSGTLSTLTNANVSFSAFVTGGNINFISDVISGQSQPNVTLFAGTLTQRSGQLRFISPSDLGSSATLNLDIIAAGAIGTNSALGAANRTYLNGSGSNYVNNITVSSAGFIFQNGGSNQTFSGNISGAGVLNIMDENVTLKGNNSAFAGTYNLWQANAQISINSTTASSASAKYTFSTEGTVLGTSSYNANITGGGTVNMGELSTTGATTNSQLRNSLANVSTFSIGALNTSSTFGGTIVNGTGTIALTKVGTGALTLTGSNTYTGATTINAGALLINGSTAVASAIAVNASGSLGGTGTAAGAVTLNSGGSIDPGNVGASGTLTVGSLLWNGGGVINLSLGTTSDLLTISGALTKGSGSPFTFNLFDAGGVTASTYTLLNFGSTNFSLADFSTNGLTGTLSLNASNLQFTVTAVPEPSTYLLMALGLLLLWVVHCRKKLQN